MSDIACQKKDKIKTFRIFIVILFVNKIKRIVSSQRSFRVFPLHFTFKNFVRSFSFLVFLFCLIPQLSAQNDSSYVKYTKGFVFNDGIYLSFKEFKNNKPSLNEFEAIKEDLYGEEGSVILKYPCPDSIESAKKCILKDCFGYCKNNIVYFSQGYSGYYYRMFIIGALSHYIAIHFYSNDHMYISQEPNAFIGTTSDYTEYLLDFETGEKFRFTYKDFCNFLINNDKDLYDELQKTKHKRDMIHHFLLKYNDKHPIYFPVN